ncbi:haloacid dehalogenase-like hydrolase [Bathymodiolus thermophilus thioautotrophic gill symbiont]|uniref:Phosphoserine phosphatase n=1 Tax=Bathymodiolus thermophilus thioautotrophic gill symbiont TaxID=2360 RepID=A0A8H8XAP0_9GAMM|nr:haloacid dehalogenase-like hydrolase [Bathymodiolus thermophilus thioautotrophic gill symbiont]CAB5494102.1 hypothetical protein THERMOS_43 [Bathymodiolus thermophilus thioautotrophic gill symbiont]
MPKKNTAIAIVYDFDGTLAQGNIQENSFIPNLGLTTTDFWKEVKEITKENEMDEILAYMYLLIEKAKEKKVSCKKEKIKEHGQSVKYFEGVEQYFARINQYAKDKCIDLTHYIISSGTKEMIEGTSIATEFKCIFASSFKYDHEGVPEWPALAINYTTKTQYLFRINKGIYNAWDNSSINKYTSPQKRPILFENMIYIGDGATDIPAMKMLNYQGGTSIAVYSPETKEAKEKAQELLQNDRANYVAKADYSDGSEIDQILKSILNQISTKASVEQYTK